VRVLDYERLPMRIRVRLFRALTGGAAPQPLLKEARDERLPFLRTHMRCLALALAALGAETYLWFGHFGDLYDLKSLQPVPYAALHALAAGALALAVLATIYVEREATVVPLPKGKYLFPQDLLEVEGRTLTVTSLETLRDLELAPDGDRWELALHFQDGGWTRLRLAKREDPRRLVDTARRVIEKARGLVAREDEAKARDIDPLFEVRLGNAWARYEAPKGERSGKGIAPRRALLWMLVFSLFVGVLSGPVLWEKRNEQSDDAMFERVRAARYVPGTMFEANAMQYERVGKRHLGALEDVRYERAISSRASLLEYLRWSHERRSRGGSAGKYQDEVDDALFENVKAENTAESFRAYLEHGKRHVVEAQVKLQAEIHKRYEARRASFLARDPSHRTGTSFCLALLDELDKRADPRVVLQIVAAPSDTLVEADKAFAKDYGTEYDPASPSFGPKILEEVLGSEAETVVRKALGARFGKDIEILKSSNEPHLPRLKVQLRVVPPKKETKASEVAGLPPPLGANEFVIGVELSGKSLEQTIAFTSAPRPIVSPFYRKHLDGDFSAEQRRLLFYSQLVGNAKQELGDYLEQTL